MLEQSGLNRRDINNPEDVQYLVDKGWAWKSGPKTLQVIFGHIIGGRVRRAPEMEPPNVKAFLDEVMAPADHEADATYDDGPEA